MNVVIEKLSNLNYLIRNHYDTYPVVVHVNRMQKWNGEAKFKDDDSNTDNEETSTATHPTPETANTATTITHGIENSSNNTTTIVHQPTIANTNPVIEPINGDNIEVNVKNKVEGATGETNEIPPQGVLPEELMGLVKRKRDRPRKDPSLPKATTIPTPHRPTHNL